MCDQSLKLSENKHTVDVGQAKMSKHNFVVNGPKFTDFLCNAEETAVDDAFYHLSISLSIPEIFALKVQSCPIKQQFLDVFCLPKF